MLSPQICFLFLSFAISNFLYFFLSEELAHHHSTRSVWVCRSGWWAYSNDAAWNNPRLLNVHAHSHTHTHKCTGYISRRASVFLLFSLANIHSHTAHRGCQRRWLRGVLSKQRSLKKKRQTEKKSSLWWLCLFGGEIEVWTRCRKISRPFSLCPWRKSFIVRDFRFA